MIIKMTVIINYNNNNKQNQEKNGVKKKNSY